MQAGNIVMKLGIARVVYAGLSAVYDVRLFDISPTSPWAWVAIFFLDDFTYYWFHRISHECRFWWAARSWREALGVIFGPPGWRPGGRGLTSKNIRNERHARRPAR